MIVAAEYHSKDFDWEELRQEVENDPSLSYHWHESLPASSSLPCAPPSLDSEAWSDFHTRHSTGKFFKERRYLLKEFPELVSSADYAKVLEVGCGNGSSILPIMRSKDKINVYACDCSAEALERAKENLEHANVACLNERLHLFTCDFSATSFPQWVVCDSCQQTLSAKLSCDPGGQRNQEYLLSGPPSSEENNCCARGVDFVTLIFTLSAVPVERMPRAIRECFSVLKPGGYLFFRDYGLYDMTMLRFEPKKRVGFREYVRSDGTRSYFFSLERVRDLFVDAGFVELELEYCCIKSVNRQKKKCMRRVWVHGKFQKPL